MERNLVNAKQQIYMELWETTNTYSDIVFCTHDKVLLQANEEN